MRTREELQREVAAWVTKLTPAEALLLDDAFFSELGDVIEAAGEMTPKGGE